MLNPFTPVLTVIDGKTGKKRRIWQWSRPWKLRYMFSRSAKLVDSLVEQMDETAREKEQRSRKTKESTP